MTKEAKGRGAIPSKPVTSGSAWRGFGLRLGAAVLSGVCIFSSFPYTTTPDVNIWPLAWVGLVPLLWLLEGARPWQGFRRAWLVGFVANFGGFWWIAGLLEQFGHLPPTVAWPLCAVYAAYQGLCFGIFGGLLCRIRGADRSVGMNVFCVAAVFTAVEFLFPLIFPWYLANSQYRTLPVIQIVDLVGVSGVTFVLVLANASLYRCLCAWRERSSFPRRQLVGSAVLCLVTVGYGFVRLHGVDAAMAEADKIRIGLVEADIGIWEKESKGFSREKQRFTLHRNLLRHQRMSQSLASDGVDLILWPESSYFPLESYVYAKRSSAFAFGLSAEGQLTAWRDHGEAGFQWSLSARLPMGSWRSVATPREDVVVAVGDGGKVAVWNGKELRTLPTGTEAKLRDVAGVVDSTPPYSEDGRSVFLWAVGAKGALLVGNASDRLERIASHTLADLNAIALVAPDRGYAVGDKGTVVTIRPCGRTKDCRIGRALEPTQVPGTPSLYDLWVDRSGRSAFAVGARGSVFRRTNRGWKREKTPIKTSLRTIAGAGVDGLWAGGDAGVILRRSAADEAWVREEIGSSSDVLALGFDARGVLWATTADGGHWRRTEAGQWSAVEAPGLPPVVSLSASPYTRVDAMPRDLRYVYQSDVAIPSVANYRADPSAEHELTPADRNAVQRAFKTPMVFGGITWQRGLEGSQRRAVYNTAMMLDEIGRVVGSYDKVHLLMFGEYIPFGDVFPELYEWLPQVNHFQAGTSVEIFPWRGHRLGVMICYEDILPSFNQRLLAKRPELLLNVTNDAWFGKTSEPYLHLALSVFRSIEGRIGMVRSTNTGVSAFVAPTGEILAQTTITGAETLTQDMPLMKSRTVYAAVGDVFAYANLGCLAFLLLRAGRRRQRRQRSQRGSKGATKPDRAGRS